jgi:hypothetical protein
MQSAAPTRGQHQAQSDGKSVNSWYRYAIDYADEANVRVCVVHFCYIPNATHLSV